MKTEKAELEIKHLLDSGLTFKYDFDYSSWNKINLAINKEGYSIKDIILKLKDGEKIIFMLNDGNTWNSKWGNESKLIYNEQYDGSIYWEHEIYGNLVRVDSNMGSLQELTKELYNKFNLNTLPMKTKTGIELITTERQEQLQKHNRSIADDVKYNTEFQLSEAASFLCLPDLDPSDYNIEDNLPKGWDIDISTRMCDKPIEDNLPKGWDIDISTRMCDKPYVDRLIIAGALIAAEIDRLNEMDRLNKNELQCHTCPDCGANLKLEGDKLVFVEHKI